MGATKVAITIDDEMLKRLDRLVAEEHFPKRSKAIQEAVREKLQMIDRTRLASECANLNPAAEQQLAEEGIAEDLARWPEY